jgi:hypothetical protein
VYYVRFLTQAVSHQRYVYVESRLPSIPWVLGTIFVLILSVVTNYGLSEIAENDFNLPYTTKDFLVDFYLSSIGQLFLGAKLSG